MREMMGITLKPMAAGIAVNRQASTGFLLFRIEYLKKVPSDKVK